VKNITNWQILSRISDDRLFAARAQLHQAAQLLTALGISFIPPKPDDSHTSFKWSQKSLRFLSQGFGDELAFRLSLNPVDLTLQAFHSDEFLAEIKLNGVTLKQAAADLQFFLEDHGLPEDVFTMKRHFELPNYPDRWDTAFDISDTDAFQSLAASYSNAASAFEIKIKNDSRASTLMIWPHHFDLATLIGTGEGKSIGMGISPGDGSYTAPYYYISVSPYPSPEQIEAQPLTQGAWHTQGWTGMVLTLDQITVLSDAAGQKSVVETFLNEALSHAEIMSAAK